ncbi:hypothetical protein [Dietzia sp. CH92]|uniref:hypothetical protein n=1 Tax=Dietzia sp. CH92 TaxID=3051823 RepID=UPI0028D2387C|nr:hypothetical protein [Dietzia sp. CH92]
MSETTDPTLDAPDTVLEDQAPDVDQHDDEPDNPNHEAAKYRHRAKEAEAARDQATARADELAAHVTDLRRALVETEVARFGIKSDAFWAAEPDLDTLVDDTGRLDLDAVTEAVRATRDRFGIKPQGYRRGGRASGATATGDTVTASWSDVIRPGRG